jgi:hypothetical protein
MAMRGFIELEELLGICPHRDHAGSFNDFAAAAIDRSGNPQPSIHMDAGSVGRHGLVNGKTAASTGRHWRRMRRADGEVGGQRRDCRTDSRKLVGGIGQGQGIPQQRNDGRNQEIQNSLLYLGTETGPTKLDRLDDRTLCNLLLEG